MLRGNIGMIEDALNSRIRTLEEEILSEREGRQQLLSVYTQRAEELREELIIEQKKTISHTLDLEKMGIENMLYQEADEEEEKSTASEPANEKESVTPIRRNSF